MKVIPLYPTFNEANCYIAVPDGLCECAVFDPGDNAQRIINRADRNGLKISKIILTHAHFDHIMAVNELAALTGAEIIIHKDDLQALYEPSLNLSHLGTGKYYTVNSDLNITTVSDNDIIRLCDECFTVISTPGHTSGSACFMCGDIIFTGDTLFGSNIGRTDFPGGSTGQIKKSLARLRDLPGDYTLYPGHGGETTLSRERQHNYYLFPEFTDK
ncbi:MAG: MBL fold metallo-hydrolase [Clostridia bacterium]|nr:MBL fold metallo-hydrolase [Clostridia bacterium]